MRQKPAARDRETGRRMREQGFTGYDIVAGVARLAAMNLYLHGIGRADTTPIHRADALLADPGIRWEVILTNPPFGRRQSIQAFTGDGEAETEREDYQRPDVSVKPLIGWNGWKIAAIRPVRPPDTQRTKFRPAARRAEAANAARGFCRDAKAAGWPPRHAAGVPSARRV